MIQSISAWLTINIRIICYDLPGRSEQPKWQYPIPSHLTSFVGDQAIIQTNDFITVLALNGRILAWDENGNMIGNEPLHQKQVRSPVTLLPTAVDNPLRQIFSLGKRGRYTSQMREYTWSPGAHTNHLGFQCTRTVTSKSSPHIHWMTVPRYEIFRVSSLGEDCS